MNEWKCSVKGCTVKYEHLHVNNPWEKFEDDEYIQKAREMFAGNNVMNFEIFHVAMYLRFKDIN